MPDEINGISEIWPDKLNGFFVVLAADCQGHDAAISNIGVIAVEKHLYHTDQLIVLIENESQGNYGRSLHLV